MGTKIRTNSGAIFGLGTTVEMIICVETIIVVKKSGVTRIRTISNLRLGRIKDYLPLKTNMRTCIRRWIGREMQDKNRPEK